MQRRSRFAAGGHEQTYGEQKGKDEGAGDAPGMEHAVALLVKALKLELGFPGDALALMNDHFTLLDIVVDRLHGFGHGLAKGQGRFSVQRQGGHDQRGEQGEDGPFGLRRKVVVRAQSLIEGGKQGGNVPQVGSVGAQRFRTVFQIADYYAVLGGKSQPRVADDAFAKLGFHPGQGHVQNVFLHMRLRPHDKIFHADRLRKLRIQSLQKIFARCSRIKIVYFFEDAEDLRSHGRDFGHAEVEDIGLEHGHLILSGLRGLGVFNRQTALGHDVTVRNLSGS